MPYVDGFVVPVPKANLAEYAKISRKAGKVWKEHGALEYRECVGDDLDIEMGTPFARLCKLKSDETVVFAYIVYQSRSHRDKVNKKVLNDPRIKDMPPEKLMPFNPRRMTYGGFKVFVDV